jgi:hypothetical protein
MSLRKAWNPQDEHAAEKMSYSVILSEAKNLASIQALGEQTKRDSSLRLIV